MFDEPTNLSKVAVAVKEPEVFKVISEIKNELFRIREVLSPVLQGAEQLKQTSPSGSTVLQQELMSVLEIVKDLKQDIYL